VDDDQLGFHGLERRRHGFRAAVSARDDGHRDRRRAEDVPKAAYFAGRRRDDRGIHRLGLRQRGERPGDERPPADIDEGLRAAGSEPLSGAGGRNDCRGLPLRRHTTA
jgi:hypothetical protein